MSRFRGFLFILSLAVFAAGCSLPKVIVLHDPLSADEHIRLGGIYESQGKTDLARDQYRAATRQDRKHVRAWMLYGDVSYRLGEYPAAESSYERALDLDPRDGDLLNNLAWVYVQQDKKLQQAEDLVRRALELKPENRPYYLDTLGVVLLKLGKTADAISTLREAVDAIPPDRTDALAEAYLHLSEAYTAEGDEARSRDALHQYEKLKKGP
jgi:Tfp pilus assembly protein PilF